MNKTSECKQKISTGFKNKIENVVPVLPLSCKQINDLEPKKHRNTIQNPEYDAKIVEHTFKAVQVEPNNGITMQSFMVPSNKSKTSKPPYVH